MIKGAEHTDEEEQSQCLKGTGPQHEKADEGRAGAEHPASTGSDRRAAKPGCVAAGHTMFRSHVVSLIVGEVARARLGPLNPRGLLGGQELGS